MTNQYLPIPKFDTAGREHGLKILPRRKSADAAFAAVKKSISASEIADRMQLASEVAYEMRQLAAQGMGDAVRNRQAVS